MNRRRAGTLTLIALVTLAAVVAWWLRAPDPLLIDSLARDTNALAPIPIDVTDLDIDAVRAKAALAARDSGPAGNVLPATLPALPDPALPLVDQLDVLLERAAAGDAVSACRLAFGRGRCAAHANRQQMAEQLEARLTEGSIEDRNDFMVRAIAQMETENANDSHACEGLDVSVIPALDELLEPVVGVLTPQQKTILAMLRPDGSLLRLLRASPAGVSQGVGDYIAPQFFADHALAFLQAGVAAADPLALEGLIMVHAPGYLPVTQNGPRIALPNPYLFAVYAQLMQGLYGPESLGRPVEGLLARTLQQMPPDRLARIREDVDARQQQWLRIRPMPSFERDLPLEGHPSAWCD